MTHKRGLYGVLGVDENATPEVIRKAYRKRAAVLHPDNQETGNNASFQELVAAHRILADPTKKTIYDQSGIVWGEDPLGDKAHALLITVAAEQAFECPNGNLVKNMRGQLARLQQQTTDAITKLEGVIETITARWIGAETVKGSILMNFGTKLSTLRSELRIQEKAVALLSEADYKMPEAQPWNLESFWVPMNSRRP